MALSPFEKQRHAVNFIEIESDPRLDADLQPMIIATGAATTSSIIADTAAGRLTTACAASRVAGHIADRPRYQSLIARR
jgi:hypothetical protein